MMDDLDIRWHQRFIHYRKALIQMGKAVELNRKRPLSELEKQGLIKAFEFTHELAWNVMKDFFEHQGNSSIMGSRDATREAFNRKLIRDGETWMEMIKSRNQTAHAYNQEVADEIALKAATLYYQQFLELEEKLQMLMNER
jgi:nucleotidyltransferase substrate binding protein (TIGR01987 family)